VTRTSVVTTHLRCTTAAPRRGAGAPEGRVSGGGPAGGVTPAGEGLVTRTSEVTTHLRCTTRRPGGARLGWGTRRGPGPGGGGFGDKPSQKTRGAGAPEGRVSGGGPAGDVTPAGEGLVTRTSEVTTHLRCTTAAPRRGAGAPEGRQPTGGRRLGWGPTGGVTPVGRVW
jgi:hypothetical protein